jgi:hypothetical protein
MPDDDYPEQPSAYEVYQQWTSDHSDDDERPRWELPRVLVTFLGLAVAAFSVVLLLAVPSIRSSASFAALLIAAAALGLASTVWIARQAPAISRQRLGVARRHADLPAGAPAPPTEAPPRPLTPPFVERRESITGPSESWKSPSLVIPAGAVIVAAIIAVAVPAIALYRSSSTTTLDCVAERSAAADLFDKHPESARVPYGSKSELEKQCQINEFVARLKPVSAS